MNYGLVLKPVGKKDWQAGQGKATQRFGGADLNASGDWTKYNPNREYQAKNGVETMNCSNYGTHNALIALAKFLGFEFPSDASERFSGVMTGTTKSGNDPHHVIEEIRSFCGVISEPLLPFDNSIRTWEDYYSPQPMDEMLVKQGQAVLKRITIGHQWVFNGFNFPPSYKHALLKQYLKRGTVCVSVDAWSSGSIYTKPKGGQDNHWVWLVRFDGDNPVIRDQYAPFDKTLAADYDFSAAKVYFMTKNESGLDPNTFSYILWLIARGRFAEALSLFPKKLGAWTGFARS